MSELMENEEGRAEGIGAPAGALEKTVEFDIDKDEDTALVVSDTPSSHEPDALDAHASAGHDLIAIDGKKPVASGWRRVAPLSLDDAKARMARGSNVGVRLPDIDLVVDVDPRNFAAGDDPLVRLKADFGLPEAPFVRTGGGGLRIYMRKPGDMTVRGKLDLFEGIEFKSVGFQVVATGSIHPETGKPYRLDQWKALYGGLYPDGEILNAVWKSRIPIRKFERLVYLPEASEFPHGGKSSVYNIWRKSGVEARSGDVKPFLDHMAFLFPNEADRELVLDYLALLTQKPAQKIHFALLVRGSQGTGKSWIGNLMEKIIGRPNVVRPSNDEVVSRWTHWMEGAQLAIVEELMTLGRLEVANRLKPVITDPMIRIEEKNCSLYSIPNHLNFICFTNHEDALRIEHGDRRWLVVFSPAVKKEPEYYARLFGYLEHGSASFVKHWLLQRQIVLNGHGVAPATSGKETMRRMSMGDVESYLLDLYEGCEAPFDFDLLRVDDLVQAVPAKLSAKSSLRSRLSKFLKEELGAVAHTRYTKQHANRPPWQLWSLRNHDVWDNIGASGRIDAYMAHYAIDLMPPSTRRW